jgi:molybdopterin-biosynthesis enzyme MoeA-like protein
MDAADTIATVEEATTTERTRIGSDKALVAATGANLEADAVWTAAATREAGVADALEGWGAGAGDGDAAAVADAFGQELVLEPDAEDALLESIADYRDVDPEELERAEIDLDFEAWGATPEGGRPLLNPVGLSPGAVVENVYVLPGPPEEFEAMFETVGDEFGGDAVSETLATSAPEASLTEVLAEFREQFDLVIGSYPSRQGHNRLKVTGTDAEAVAEGIAWLRQHVETVEDSTATE